MELGTSDYILGLIERLQFMGHSHNSKNYERVLTKFSSNVQKRVSEQVIKFWGWWHAYSLWGAHITQKAMNGFWWNFQVNAQKGSRNKWLNFEGDGIARLQFMIWTDFDEFFS